MEFWGHDESSTLTMDCVVDGLQGRITLGTMALLLFCANVYEGILTWLRFFSLID